MEALTHDPVGEAIKNGNQGHALVMRHVGANDRYTLARW